MSAIRDYLEGHQAAIYFTTIFVAALAGFLFPALSVLDAAINPVLALMLFVTFLQVPLVELGKSFIRWRFLSALMVSNFIVLPLFLALLFPIMPGDPIIRLGILLVLLAPCIDYVVTFAHLGRSNMRALLAATPLLLICQIVLLPFYLRLFLGADAALLIQAEPFIHAFVWLIVVPLLLAFFVQFGLARMAASPTSPRISEGLGLLPVPATALVLFVVVASVLPQLGQMLGAIWVVIPIYLCFALVAPLIGWAVSGMFRLEARDARSVSFSTATRNSLVVLPLAFSVPSAAPLLPAIIILQTMIELVSELFYIRLIPMLIGGRQKA